MKPNHNLDDIVSMLDLDAEGVRVVIKDEIKTRRSQAAGHYSPRRRVISINKAIIPYWVPILATVLHEFRHHIQRTKIIASMAICVGGGLASWSYGMLIDNDLFIYALPLSITAIGIMAHRYFEWDAKRYERGHLAGILFIIQALEHTWIAWTLGLQRVTRNNLRRLQKEILKSAPKLLEEFGEDKEAVELDAR